MFFVQLAYHKIFFKQSCSVYFSLCCRGKCEQQSLQLRALFISTSQPEFNDQAIWIVDASLKKKKKKKKKRNFICLSSNNRMLPSRFCVTFILGMGGYCENFDILNLYLRTKEFAQFCWEKNSSRIHDRFLISFL